MISALVWSSRPLMDASPLLPLEDAARDMRARRLSHHLGCQQKDGSHDHRLATHGPVRAQTGAEKKDWHDRQQNVVPEHVHLFLLEPGRGC
jgi:hypothetical protein